MGIEHCVIWLSDVDKTIFESSQLVTHVGITIQLNECPKLTILVTYKPLTHAMNHSEML